MSSFVFPLLFFVVLMAAMAGVVLLIACANIAGVLIGRAAARRREIAVRLALGAGRGRLVRQLVTESLVLAFAGGGLGVLLALWLLGGVNAAVAQLPVPMAFDLRLDRRVLLYALGLSTLAALVFGLAPARRAARFDVVSSLKNGVGGSVARQRLRRGLVIGQIAACSALLVWSGLFARSLGRIHDVDPGFDPRGVLLARMAFDDLAHDPAQTVQTLVGIQQRLEQAPHVESVGLSTVVPLSLENEEFDVVIDGSQRLRVMANRLTPGWFETVRIPLLAGRDFTWGDRAGAPDVAIVNDTFARRIWNGAAIGQRLRVFDRDVQVVGVARDSKYWTLGETTEPTIYLPFQQGYFRYVTFHVKTSNRTAATALLTADVRRVAPDVFVDVSPMTDVLSVAVFPARIGAAVTGAFGVLAMMLAALGVYGLVAFSVAQRTAEIGVRKVVGARAIDLVRLIVSENAALAAIGLGVGLALGTVGATLLRSFITDVSPIDPLTLAGTAVLVMGVTLAASASPALRAVRVDPLVVLRDA
jgi:predicted permease